MGILVVLGWGYSIGILVVLGWGYSMDILVVFGILFKHKNIEYSQFVSSPHRKSHLLEFVTCIAEILAQSNTGFGD